MLRGLLGFLDHPSKELSGLCSIESKRELQEIMLATGGGQHAKAAQTPPLQQDQPPAKDTVEQAHEDTHDPAPADTLRNGYTERKGVVSDGSRRGEAGREKPPVPGEEFRFPTV